MQHVAASHSTVLHWLSVILAGRQNGRRPPSPHICQVLNQHMLCPLVCRRRRAVQPFAVTLKIRQSWTAQKGTRVPLHVQDSSQTTGSECTLKYATVKLSYPTTQLPKTVTETYTDRKYTSTGRGTACSAGGGLSRSVGGA